MYIIVRQAKMLVLLMKSHTHEQWRALDTCSDFTSSQMGAEEVGLFHGRRRMDIRTFTAL